jgi:hypothetical protein
MAGTNHNQPPSNVRPPSPFKPDTTVYEPESLKKARRLAGMTDEQARREQAKNKGNQVR